MGGGNAHSGGAGVLICHIANRRCICVLGACGLFHRCVPCMSLLFVSISVMGGERDTGYANVVAAA